jgi:oligosaccharide translocation protein RFT1
VLLCFPAAAAAAAAAAGITEAFTHAVLGAAALNRSNALLLVFTGVHLACSVALVTRLGAVGLIAADALNMLLRVAYSSW